MEIDLHLRRSLRYFSARWATRECRLVFEAGYRLRSMATTTTRLRAAIYARISDDRDGTGLGVARQESDCRARIDIEGWDLVGTYIDNDISAYSGKARPRWEALVDDVAAGKVDRIVCWAADRLTRHPRELEDLVDLLEETGARVVALKDGDYDLSTSGGRLVARILGSVARQESERKSERSRRKHEEMALAGHTSGGGDRPFGFEEDHRTIRPSEAKLIREAAVRIIDGESVNSILRDWYDRQIVGVRGKPIPKASFRRMMKSGRIAGLRTHRGRIVADAQWPAIVDRETWEKVRRILTDPSRNLVIAPKRYLLTGGLAVCGRCGQSLSARPANAGRKAYQCVRRNLDDPNCGRLKVDAAGLEELVGAEIVTFLTEGDRARIHHAALNDALSQADVSQLLSDMEAVESSLGELEDDYYQQRLIGRDTYLAQRAALTGRLDDIEIQLQAPASVPSSFDADTDPATWWEEATMEERRDLLAVYIEQVIVAPAVWGRNFFDPGRVSLKWLSE